MNTLKHWIMSQRSVNLIFEDGIKSVLVENPLYAKIKEMLDSHKTEDIHDLVNIANKIVARYNGLFGVDESTGIVYYAGDALPSILSTRLIQFAENDLDAGPLLAFWNNVKLNPSMESVKDLYGFLEHNNIPLTADGCFVAYKKVNDNFMDCRTGTFDNHIGNVVKMPREQVDPDRNNTCSSGLHVAAYKYAWDFSQGHLIEVKINPKDVVAVPPDYNQEKMRVCEYEVIREVEDPNKEVLYKHDESYQNNVEGNDSDEDLELETEDIFEPEDKDEVDVEGMVLTPGANGRLRLPAKLVREVLGLNPGDAVFVSYPNQDDIIVERHGHSEVSDITQFMYIVDCHYNVRIGNNLKSNCIVKVDMDEGSNQYIKLTKYN